MSTSNVARTRQYLQAVASMGPPENVSAFYTPDVVIQEFPNRIAPNGRVRRAADCRAAYEQGRKILQSQRYDVQRIVEAGDEVAVELEWTGVLAVPVMNLPAGSESLAMKPHYQFKIDGSTAHFARLHLGPIPHQARLEVSGKRS